MFIVDKFSWFWHTDHVNVLEKKNTQKMELDRDWERMNDAITFGAFFFSEKLHVARRKI